MKVLLGVTGSVATTVLAKLVEEFLLAGHEVQMVATQSAEYFFEGEEIGVRVWRDKDEWFNGRYVNGQPIPHIELGKWADVLVIAPLSANTLAKLANGQCDNLLTCLARAWDLDKPVVVAPAMNTRMWNHPATAKHLHQLGEWYNLKIVRPISKKLACGDEGMGAMASSECIGEAVNGF